MEINFLRERQTLKKMSVLSLSRDIKVPSTKIAHSRFIQAPEVEFS